MCDNPTTFFARTYYIHANYFFLRKITRCCGNLSAQTSIYARTTVCCFITMRFKRRHQSLQSQGPKRQKHCVQRDTVAILFTLTANHTFIKHHVNHFTRINYPNYNAYSFPFPFRTLTIKRLNEQLVATCIAALRREPLQYHMTTLSRIKWLTTTNVNRQHIPPSGITWYDGGKPSFF